MWLVIVLASVFYYTFLATRFFNILQLDSYQIKYHKKLMWYYAFILFATSLGIIALIVCYTTLEGALYEFLGLCVQIIPLTIIVVCDMFTERKTPIKFTNRMKRLYLTFIVLSTIISLIIAFGSKLAFGDYVRLMFLGNVSIPVFVYLSLYLNKPIENRIKNNYISKCKIILESNKNLIKIGITGSYGKTSVKEIIATMLKKKFNVIASPASYNTPMGLCKTVAELTPETEIIIMEMGARHVGDIKELATIFKPNIGVITGISNQHIETFKSLENIINTKYELIQGLQAGGKAVFNGESEGARRMYFRCPNNKHLTRLFSGYTHASEVETTEIGTSFVLHIGNMQQKCKTKLIGKHNLINILVSANVADLLGVDLNSICEAISELNFTPHRLEVIKLNNGVTVIDDSYNCNVIGAQSAIETLALFKGRKIICTQGLVELGDVEEEENYRLGVKISAVADITIVIGERGEIIKKGLIDGGYNPTKIIYFNTLKEAQNHFGSILKGGDVLLLMNDLPDNY